MDDVINIYPTSEELLTISNCVGCPECNMTFRSTSNLTLHLTKTHQRTSLEKLDPLQIKLYHCPETKCNYNTILKPFRTYKLLKQHYLKVHAVKQLSCAICGKCFPLRSQYIKHIPYCGILFNCNSCPALYDTYETLKTHARRKCHSVDAKITFSRMPQLPTKSKSELLPSRTHSAQLLLNHRAVASYSDEQLILSKSSQTDVKQQTSRLVLPRLDIREDNMRFAETQTVGDYPLKKSNSSEESFDKKTQTRKVPSCTKSCNTSLVLNDNVEVDIVKGLPKESIHSSTQTHLQIPIDNLEAVSLPAVDLISTTCDLTTELYADDDDTLFFNMETQTDCTEFITDMLDCDYYSNMYTQTCSDIFNEDLGLNNICTQTSLLDDDLLLRSVESQTTMSHSSGSFTMCRDFSHMHTQTDAEFKELLDAINA